MKQIKKKFLFFITCLCIPSTTLAISAQESSKNVSVDISNFIDTSAVINDGKVASGNFSLIILGLIIVMIILIGTVMFASKK